jgi:hypothetical protein
MHNEYISFFHYATPLNLSIQPDYTIHRSTAILTSRSHHQGQPQFIFPVKVEKMKMVNLSETLDLSKSRLLPISELPYLLLARVQNT